MASKTQIGRTVFAFFRLPEPVPKYGAVSSEALRKKLILQFPSLGKPGAYIEFLDSWYNPVPLSIFSKLMEMNYFKNQPYSSEYDCDNYSFSLKGLFENIGSDVPLGIVHARIANTDKKHSLNIWYDPEARKFKFVEPQTGAIFSSLTYEPYMVIM